MQRPYVMVWENVPTLWCGNFTKNNIAIRFVQFLRSPNYQSCFSVIVGTLHATSLRYHVGKRRDVMVWEFNQEL
ncbi:MAG: hypothetical protein AAGJ08_18390 [Cyanobacteria bacterium P01_H01_bin.35]